MATIITILIGFFKAFRYWHVIVFTVLIQLAFGWLLAFPMVSVMEQQWDHSMLPLQIEGSGFTQAMVFDELLNNNFSAISNSYQSPLFLFIGISFILISTFILAGLLPLYFGLDLKFNWDRFWSDGARSFRSFLALIVIAIPFFVLADFISNLADKYLILPLAVGNSEAAQFVTVAILSNGFRFFLFALVVILFQYAKIVSASQQLRNVFYLIRNAFTFVGKHFFRIILIFLILAILDQGLFMLDTVIWTYLVQDAGVGFQWAWLLISSFLMIFMKFSYFACQGMLYVELKRRDVESGSVRNPDKHRFDYTAGY
jgi:hypothetical protein